MKKLRLDDLSVESFATTAMMKSRGTVLGHTGFCWPTYGDPTCDPTCTLESCDDTCAGFTNQCVSGGGNLSANTCDAQYNTCQRTCQPAEQ